MILYHLGLTESDSGVVLRHLVVEWEWIILAALASNSIVAS